MWNGGGGEDGDWGVGGGSWRTSRQAEIDPGLSAELLRGASGVVMGTSRQAEIDPRLSAELLRGASDVVMGTSEETHRGVVDAGGGGDAGRAPLLRQHPLASRCGAGRLHVQQEGRVAASLVQPVQCPLQVYSVSLCERVVGCSASQCLCVSVVWCSASVVSL